MTASTPIPIGMDLPRLEFRAPLRRQGRGEPAAVHEHRAVAAHPPAAARGAAASWPHAAAMSRPRVSLTVAGRRAASSTALKRAIASRDEPSYIPVGL